jgi:hypothetical protein
MNVFVHERPYYFLNMTTGFTRLKISKVKELNNSIIEEKWAIKQKNNKITTNFRP